MFVPKIDKLIGIEVYATKSSGIGGIIRESFKDFTVKEILVDGSEAEINPSIERQALSSSPVKGRYLLCVLAKRNWDTFLAVKNVARQLGINIKRIHIGGLKDAKAVTAQHITIENVSIEEIQKIHIKDVEVRPLGYLCNRLSAYYLLGNIFHIRVKAINHSKSTVEKQLVQIIEELANFGGVTNFFGYQRFGTIRPITHLVGKAIVKGNLRKATMIMLAKSSIHENPASKRCREELQETQDFKHALKSFPKQLHYEKIMLAHLVKRPNDFSGAFRRLPIKLRKLFIQAYQSYLFNKFLSKRIENDSSLNIAEVGDYVINIEHSGLPMLTTKKTVKAEIVKEINNLIKEEKIRLAIPLIGFKQHTSQGVLGEIEKQILEEQGVSSENFKITTIPEISERGTLRTAVTPLKDFSLQKITRDNSLRKCAIELIFALFRGSYATIFLRELMKPRNPIKAGF